MEVIIIGGGPAGAIAARTLAEAGIRTYLIERDLKRVKPCGGGIPSAAFEEFRIPESLIERRVTKIGAISPSLKEITIPLKGGYLAMVRREVFDSYLRKKAEDAGAELIEGLFLDLKRGSKIETVYRNKGVTKRLYGDVLIAADGANSSIALAMGERPPRMFLALQERIKVSQELLDNYSDRCEFWFGSDISPILYGWVFPKGDHLCIGTGTDPKDSRRLIDYLRRFKEKLGRRLGNMTVIKREASPGSIDVGRRMVFGNILLCGDAAGLILPVSAEGIYYAMKSGKMAAEEIIRNGRNNALEGYEEKWKRLYGGRFSFMKRLQDTFYRDDDMRERLVKVHGIKAIQRASMKLWLKKDLSPLALMGYKLRFKAYIKIFRPFRES